MIQKIKTWLFNPFQYIAGWKALFGGMAIMLVSAFISSYAPIMFDGVLDFHLRENISMFSHIMMMGIDWLSISVVLAIFGFSMGSANSRLIDIVGTQAMARAPFIIMAFAGLFMGGIHQEYLNGMKSVKEPGSLGPIIFIAILMLPFIIWSIVLMYRSYCISFHMNGQKATWTFIPALIVAEILSKYLISFII